MAGTSDLSKVLPPPLLEEQSNLYSKRTERKVAYIEQLSTQPTAGNSTAFTLNPQEFKKLQLYLLCTREAFPDSFDAFHVFFPLSAFKPWINPQPDLHNLLATALPTVQQHCAKYDANALQPAISLGRPAQTRLR